MKLQAILGAAAIALTLLGSTALTAPAMAATVPDGTKLATDQVFNYMVLDKINSLDPQIVEDVDTSYVVSDIFEGLYNEDAKGHLVPGVATGYDVSTDKTVYTFHLRPEAKWSNGDPVTAADFVFGWQRAVDPKTASPYAYFLPLGSVLNSQDIIDGKKPPTDLGVKAVDDHTFQVTLSGPTPYFPLMTTHPTLFAVPTAVVQKFGADWTKPENIVGNGAYTLKKIRPASACTLERSKSYWDDSHTVLQTVNFITSTDDEAAVTRYKAGELDQTDIPAGQYPTLKTAMGDEAHSLPWTCTYYYIVNERPDGPEWARNPDVRAALNLAIDRDIIVNNITQSGEQAAYTLTPSFVTGFKAPSDLAIADLPQADRDAKAKELMAKAGYGPDKPLSIAIISNPSSRHNAIGTAIAQMWKEKLGVDTSYSTEEFATLLADRHAGNFQAAREAWCADYNEASTFLTLLLSTSEQNHSKYSNPEFDKVMEASKTADDPNVNYTQAEAIIAKDTAVMPIFWYAKATLLKPYVGGFPFTNPEPLWYAKDLYIAAH